MVFFKGRVGFVLLVFSLLVLCASVSYAREDPELRQCKHQCRHQRQFDRGQREECETSCEEYIKEKERIQRERGEKQMGRSMGEEGREEVNPRSRHDPEQEYKRCRERCQEGEQGRREEQLCESECEERRQQQQQQEREREEFEQHKVYKREGFRGEEEEEEEESGNPYVFEEEHFTTKFKTQEGRVRVLQKFNKRSKLFKGIENFRVMIFEANPQTFIIPNHWDADAVFFVAQGKFLSSHKCLVIY